MWGKPVAVKFCTPAAPVLHFYRGHVLRERGNWAVDIWADGADVVEALS